MRLGYKHTKQKDWVVLNNFRVVGGSMFCCQQIIKQTNRQNKQTIKQTNTSNKQTHKQTNKTNTQTDKTNKQTDKPNKQ